MYLENVLGTVSMHISLSKTLRSFTYNFHHRQILCLIMSELRTKALGSIVTWFGDFEKDMTMLVFLDSETVFTHIITGTFLAFISGAHYGEEITFITPEKNQRTIIIFTLKYITGATLSMSYLQNMGSFKTYMYITLTLFKL